MEDTKIIEAFKYLADRVKLQPHEWEKLMDIICDHKFESWNDGFGNDWDKCIICGRLKVKEAD